jgi:hypothetical protein
VRIGSALLLILCIAGCNRGIQSKDAVRQGIVDHLATRGLNMSGMDLQVSSVQFNGNQADATVSFVPKGGNPSQGMTMQYHLEQQGNKWVVVGRRDSGAPHGGSAAPGAGNPHGGMAPGGETAAPGAAGKMPSPEDLPPAGKKK